jgi:hypothetical protein
MPKSLEANTPSKEQMIGDSDEIAAVGFHKFIVVVVVVELWSSESPRPGGTVTGVGMEVMPLISLM